jgi:hypothetical protein
MIIDLALASGTAPRDWADEDDATIATARQMLIEMNSKAR